MPVWEFQLENAAGCRLENILVGEGDNEEQALKSALTLLSDPSDCTVVRPGQLIRPDVAERWKEICALPVIMTSSARLYRYAHEGH